MIGLLYFNPSNGRKITFAPTALFTWTTYTNEQ